MRSLEGGSMKTFFPPKKISSATPQILFARACGARGEVCFCVSNDAIYRFPVEFGSVERKVFKCSASCRFPTLEKSRDEFRYDEFPMKVSLFMVGRSTCV